MRASLPILLLCASLPCFCQPLPSQLTRAQMQTDFDGLVSALKEAHAGLYRFNKPQDLDRRFSDYRERIPAKATTVQFASLIAEVTALMHDGHNRLEYDDGTQATLSTALLLPFQFSIEGSKLIVLFNDSPDNQSIKPGMEIVTINGSSSTKVLTNLLNKISGDGYVETGKVRRLERNLPAYYWLYQDQSSVFEIKVREANGNEFTAQLGGVTTTDRQRNRSANPVNATILRNAYIPGTQKKNVSLGFVNDIGVLAIRGFEGGPFIENLDSVFNALRQKGTTRLILDLRGNGGGVDMDGAYLVSSLTDKPFRYFDRIEMKTIAPSFTRFKESTYTNLKEGTVSDGKGGFRVLAKLHPGVELQQPAKQPFTGKLVVLIDGGSFSTTADVCAVLHHLKRAIFVGEETGGAAEGNTSGTNAQFRFPNSGLKLRISMYGYWNAVTCMPGRGTIPDVPVNRTVEDMMAGLDSQLRKALGVLSNR